VDLSVIVATLNAARFLPAALASARAQGDVAVDLVVVDAHSIDQTAEIAQSFGARFFVQEGSGLAAAWNTGITKALAPLVAFLDSDDQWIENTVAERIRSAKSTPTPTMSMGRVRYVLEPGTPQPGSLKPDLFTGEHLAPIPGTLIVPTEIFDEVGRFDTSYRVAADTEWYGRAIAAGHLPNPVNRLVLLKRIHGGNLSLQAATTRELLRALRSKVANTRFTARSGGA
jgi:glycosyltransferase involved in cell wall biosynthesis